jgi:hypothetical protein
MALFGRNAAKIAEATPKNGPYEAVGGGIEADLASSTLTLSLTKQALRGLGPSITVRTSAFVN